MRLLARLIPVALALASCQSDPARFPARLEAALASRDPAAVEHLLSRASRPVHAAMASSSQSPLRAFDTVGPARPVRVVSVQQGEGSTVLTVQAGGVQRDWVLVREDGDLRLDLLATSAHRSWTSP